ALAGPHLYVADLSREAARALVEAAAEDEARAHAATEEDHENVAHVARRAHTALPPGRGGEIVEHAHGATQGALHQAAEVHVAPAQVGPDRHHPALAEHLSGEPHADADHLLEGALREAEHARGEAADLGGHRSRVAILEDLARRGEDLALLGDEGDAHVGGAEIATQCHPRRVHHATSRSSCPRTSAKSARISARRASLCASKRSTRMGVVLDARTSPQAPSSKTTRAPSTSITR